MKIRDLPVEIIDQLEEATDFFVNFNVLTHNAQDKKSYLIHPYNKQSKQYIKKLSHLHFIHEKQLKCMMHSTEIRSDIMDFPRVNQGNNDSQVHNLYLNQAQMAFGQELEITFKATKETILLIVHAKEIESISLKDA